MREDLTTSRLGLRVRGNLRPWSPYIHPPRDYTAATGVFDVIASKLRCSKSFFLLNRGTCNDHPRSRPAARSSRCFLTTGNDNDASPTAQLPDRPLRPLHSNPPSELMKTLGVDPRGERRMLALVVLRPRAASLPDGRRRGWARSPRFGNRRTTQEAVGEGGKPVLPILRQWGRANRDGSVLKCVELFTASLFLFAPPSSDKCLGSTAHNLRTS